MVRIVPRNLGNVEHEVYIGLILQYHYLGLDKVAEPNNVVDNLNSSTDGNTADNTDNNDDPFDDVISRS